MMRNIFLIALLLMLNACGDNEGDTYTDNTVTTTSTTTNTSNYAEGDVLYCSSEECAIAPAGTDPSDSDAIVGVYDADYTQTECNAAGFFFCIIEGLCLDQELETGSCS